MVYKFRSLKEPNLKIMVNDTDGDQTTIQFQAVSGTSGGIIGLFETEEPKIAEAMLADKRNGIIYMDADYVKREAAKSAAIVEEAPKKKPRKRKPRKKAGEKSNGTKKVAKNKK